MQAGSGLKCLGCSVWELTNGDDGEEADEEVVNAQHDLAHALLVHLLRSGTSRFVVT